MRPGAGYIYFMTNRAMPGLLKVGKTTLTPQDRARHLSNRTAVPHPFVPERSFLVRELGACEREVHKRLADYHESKEFFRLPLPQAISLAMPAISARQVAGEAQPSRRPPPPASEREGKPAARKPRYWIAVCILALFVFGPSVSQLMLWAGRLVLALVVLSFVPKVKSFPRQLLRLDPAKPVWLAIKVAAFGLIGLMLLLFSWPGFEAKAEWQRAAARKAAEHVERQRVAQEANAKVAGLVGQAGRALRSGDVGSAIEALQTALGTEQATELQAAQALRRKIAQATDANAIREALIGLSDAAFTEFQEGRSIPSQFRFGHAVLNQKAEELARRQVADAAATREQRREQRLAEEKERQEKVRAAAEAERKARQEKVRAAAEAEGKARQEKVWAAAEAERKARQEKVRAATEAERKAEIEMMFRKMEPPPETIEWKQALMLLSSWTVRQYGVAVDLRHLGAVNERLSRIEGRIAEAKESRIGRYVAAAKTLHMLEAATQRFDAAAQKVRQCQQDMQRLGPVTEAQMKEYSDRMDILERALNEARSARDAFMGIRHR